MQAPQILSGFSTLLIFIPGFELIILGQGPHHMQGALIGLWFMQSFVTNINLTFLTSSLGCYCYTIAAHKYKYRQRIITQYTERQLDRKELLQRDQIGMSYYIESMVVRCRILSVKYIPMYAYTLLNSDTICSA